MCIGFVIAFLPTVGANQPDPVDVTDLPGSGTSADPYIIENVSALQAMEQDLSAHYRIGSDIDASVTATWHGGDGFEPIGPNSVVSFDGTLDGNGHEITGLTIDSSTSNIGLIGTLGDTGTVTDVSLTDVDVSGFGNVGGLVGYNYFGTVMQSSASGVVYATGENSGGLVGQNIGTVSESYADVEIDGNRFVGGLVGWNRGTVSDTYALGNVSATGDNVGGLVGLVSSPNIVENSYSIGTVSGSDDVGGLIGGNFGTITDSYWDIDSSGTTDSDGGTGLQTVEMLGSQPSSTMSGFDFGSTWSVETGFTVSYPYLDANAQDPAPGYGPLFTSGDGSEVDPYGIETWEQLHFVREALDSHFVLIDDLETSSIGYDTFVLDPSGGFEPIGDSGDPFIGSLDGDGHTISNFQIDRRGTGYDQGMFGEIGSDGIVKDVTLADVDVAGLNRVGTLVSENYGTISDVTITGVVEGSTNVGGVVARNHGGTLERLDVDVAIEASSGPAGGFVGTHTDGSISDSITRGDIDAAGAWQGAGGGFSRLFGSAQVSNVTVLGNVTQSPGGASNDLGAGGFAATATGSVVIEDSVATGTVDAEGRAGGFVGSLSGSVTNSTASGSVSGGDEVGGFAGEFSGSLSSVIATGDVTGTDEVGGLVGTSTSSFGVTSIEDSYATGSVTGNEHVGGLVGNNAGEVATSYSIGEVSGTASVGALIGTNTGSVVNSYWDLDASGETTSAVGHGLETDEMHGYVAAVEMEGFAFGENWFVTAGYPVLAFEDVPTFGIDSISVAHRVVEAGDNVTFTVTVDPSTGSPPEDIPVNVLSDGSVAGLSTGDIEYTDSNGEVTFSFEETVAATYSTEFGSPVDVTINEPMYVLVEPGPAVNVTLTPDSTHNITAGNEVDFEAEAVDIYDNLVEDNASEFDWTNAETDGRFTETTAGSYGVYASYNGIDASTVEVNVFPGPLHAVTLDPESDTQLISGNSLTFEATAIDAFDNTIEDDQSTFSFDGTTSDRTVSETEVGEYDVFASYGGIDSPTVTVTVVPASTDRIEIDPTDSQSIIAGETVSFSVDAYDRFDNHITSNPHGFSWQAADEGVFERTDAGVHTVTASRQGVTSEAVTVQVHPASVDVVALDPDTDTDITADDTLDVSAYAYDAYDNLITDDPSAFIWKNVSTAGVFTEDTVGSYIVDATYEGVSSGSITVTVDHGAVQTVVVDPATEQVIGAAETLNFSALAVDGAGNVIETGALNFEWSGANILGQFSTAVSGTYTVSAAYDGVESEPVSVSVGVGAIDSIQVVTDIGTVVTAGSQLNVEVIGYDIYGNSKVIPSEEVSFSGVDADGTFTQTSAGSHEIIAEYGGVESSPLSMNVEPGAVDSVEISPDSIDPLHPGESTQLSAVARDAFGNVMADDISEFDWIEADNGLVSFDSPGSYDVTASYDGVSSNPVSVTVLQPATFEISTEDLPPVSAGQTIDIDVLVENAGGMEGSTTVQLERSDGTVIDTVEVPLAAGESDVHRFSWTVPDGVDDGDSLVVAGTEQPLTLEMVLQTDEDDDPSDDDGFPWLIVALIGLVLLLVGGGVYYRYK